MASRRSVVTCEHCGNYIEVPRHHVLRSGVIFVGMVFAGLAELMFTGRGTLAENANRARELRCPRCGKGTLV